MPDAHDAGDGRLEERDAPVDRSDQEEVTARRYLEERRPDISPLGELPRVERRTLHEEPPQLQPEGSSACGAVARLRDAPTEGASTVDRRQRVQCLLPPHHDGPHVARSRREAPETWSVWAWE